MSKNNQKNDDYLIFIDTNKLLDSYRIQTREDDNSYIKYILDNKECIISSKQVRMEFLKNRRKVIETSLIKIKKLENNHTDTSLIYKKYDKYNQLIKIQKQYNETVTKVNTDIEKLKEKYIKTPQENDNVYIDLKSFWDKKHQWYLDDEEAEQLGIIANAKKRFEMGYPPRKDKDTSYGDSINWEWIIECAKKSKKNIIIVSTDSDYGVNLNKGEMLLNDWLLQEFQERVGNKQRVELTNSLSVAFEKINVKVNKDVKENESQMITNDINKLLNDSLSYLPNISDIITEELESTLKIVNDSQFEALKPAMKTINDITAKALKALTQLDLLNHGTGLNDLQQKSKDTSGNQ